MRNVLVTGGSRGIGLAIVRTLSVAGCRVVAIARNDSAELAAARARTEGEVHFRACDLAATDQLAAFAKSLRQEFGPIYGLVNNAGLGSAGLLANMADSAIERLVRINTIAPITLTRHVLRSMLAAGTGRIVNIASIVAENGYAGLSVYSATKASLVGFTRSLAREVGPAGITVNAVSPGFVDTEMTHDLDEAQRATLRRRSALKRMAESQDVAEAVAFLLGDGARNITGTVLTVDAGATA